ncbi:MAG: hypothetical protein CVV42_08995 [Candidatus Riflebacteria bacterium HGW-Riflebacteria-2]|jgi:CheY-like chemotaxis protein|nr:MAG: hypothetical protein CVV42_08995 [Candidatus Riflebacteria bacterium HGW-Riflebacteria-2]
MGRKILLVDDNTYNREFIRDLLGKTGLEVIEASNRQQGVELAISQRPGLILLASGMAGLNDSEDFAVLRQSSTTSMIPVISVTAKDEEDPADSYASSMRFLKQPMPVQTLVETIRPYVNAARAMVN